MKRKDIICIIGLSVLVAASCTSDELLYSDVRHSGMSFDIAIVQLQEQQGSIFRAPAITNAPMKGKGTQMYLRQTTVGSIDKHTESDMNTRGAKVEAINSFKLYSYKYSGSWDSDFSSATLVSDGETLKSAESWTSAKPWAAGSMAFFGIYDDTSTATFSNTNGGELTYTVPDAVADQKDLLVAKTVDITEATGDSKVPMTFSHALTAVQFGIGSTMADGTITKIELQGIKNTGTYSFKDGTWTTEDGTKNYSISLNVAISSNKGTGSATNLITGSNNDLLLLMPQTLGTEAKLVVYITEKGNPKTLSVSLANGQWKAGHTVTYSLSTESETGQYVFIVGDVNNASLNENGGTVSATIKSYYQDYYGTQTAVGWTATYSVDGGTSTSSTGDVVKTFMSSGSGNSDYSVTIAEVEKIFISDPESNEHTRTLRNTMKKGTSDNPINLAGTDGSETTANCYIVSAPGYYKFPVVYGNGLKNGSKNESSLTGGASYVNHLGNTISNPYLKDNPNVDPQNAVIVWQDAYHLVLPSSVTLSSDRQYLIFQVPQEYICQGNCVLAVRDASNTILWSWHIWVTDQDISAMVSTTNSTGTYNFMPIYLGHCENDTRKTKSHAIKVNLIQNISNNENHLNINQVGIQNLEISAPYYQWGRKDPTRPILISGSWKELYDNSEYPNVTIGEGYSATTATLDEIVKTPYIYYCDENTCLYSSKYSDLWHVGNTLYNESYLNANNKVVKSIYDPCPAGFKIPEIKAFSGFTIQTYTTNYCQFIPGNNWYCMGRYFQGGLRNVGTGGTCWSAGPMNQKFGYSMTYESGNCRVTDTSTHQNGFTVRPVEE